MAFPPPKSVVAKSFPSETIRLSDSLLFVGSCFSENLGGKMATLKSNVQVNPFGTLYDPFSIHTFFDRVVNQKTIQAAECVLSDELYFHWDFSHQFASFSSKQLENKLNEVTLASASFLKQANYVFITLGSSLHYLHIHSNRRVANCHKIPQTSFRRVLPTVKETAETLKQTVSLIRSFNPSIQIIFTVSPVRHLRYGAHQNNLSKSVLLLALNELLNQDASLFYFPAYELVMDDLRDHAFYETDMAHPNAKAIEYIWDRFKETMVSEALITFHQAYQKLEKSLSHRLQFPSHPKSQLFIKKLKMDISQLSERYPSIDFEAEQSRLAEMCNGDSM